MAITFSNIQSHENTHFVLKPGLNFILGEGNNIGKSAIFNVLIDIATPGKSPNWLSRIIRNGCYKASATFEFETDGQKERVIAWFSLTRPGVANLFFEQYIGEEPPVRLTECPQSLIDALGLAVVPEQGLINFNSADSTQLLSRATNESDSIISHIMTDSRVELLKDNAANLSRDVVTDYKVLNGRIQATNDVLTNMEYNYAVDEFFKAFDSLRAAAKLADAVPKEDLETLLRKPKASEEDLATLLSVYNLASCLEPIDEMPAAVDTTALKRAETVKRLLELVDPDDLKQLRKKPPDRTVLTKARKIYFVAKMVSDTLEELKAIREETAKLETIRREMSEISAYLRANTERVVCPVKGEVLFTNENCIPVGDGFTL